MGRTFFLDHEGSEQADPLRTQSSGPVPDHIDFLLRNLGWVEVRELAGSGLRLRFEPRQISDATLAGMLRLIWESEASFFAVEHLFAPGRATLLADQDKATRFVTALTRFVPNVFEQGDRYLRREVPLSESPFADSEATAQLALLSATTLKAATAKLDRLFDNRWSLYRPLISGGLSELVAVGNGYTPFNPNWGNPRHIQTVFDYADVSFGQWIATSHVEVASTRSSRCDQVDALVRFDDVGEIRLRYLRLLVFVSTIRLGDLILSAARSDELINLRPVLCEKAS